MNFYDPLQLVSKVLEITQFSIEGNPWSSRVPQSPLAEQILRSTPEACANVTTVVHLKTCIDSYCGNQSHYGTTHPDVDLNSFHRALQDALKSQSLNRVPHPLAVGKILDTYKDQLCKDQWPPPGAGTPVFVREPQPVDLPADEPARSGNCGPMTAVPPGAGASGLALLGGFLGILLFRGLQAATGAFFLFFEPEDLNSRPNGT